MPAIRKSRGKGMAIGPVGLTVLCWLGGLQQASAQTASDGDGTRVQTLVVTAQRKSENIQKVPIAIQALSGDMIRDMGIRSSVDIAELTPNLEIALPNGSGNQPTVAIRGIALADYDTNNSGPNSIYLDGAVLASPASQTFQVFDLDRIEVLKGPQGTLYGRNASGGAINFITVKPSDTFSTHLHAEYSSFNTVNLEGAVGGPLAPGLDGRIAAVYNYSDGFLYNELYHHPENGANNFAARIELQWKPTSSFSALLDIHGGRIDNRPAEYRNLGVFVPGSFNPSTFGFTFCSQTDAIAGKCVDLYGYGTNPNFYHGAWLRQEHLKVNSLGASLQLDDNLGSIKLTSLTAVEHNDKFHPEDSDNAPFRLGYVNYGVRSNTVTEELRAAHVKDRYQWVVGGYFFHEDLHQNQPLFLFLDWDKFFGPGSGNGIAEIVNDRSSQSQTSYAVFGQGDYSFTRQLKLTLGLRYTTETEHFSVFNSAMFQDNGIDNFGPTMPLWAFNGLHQTNNAVNYRAVLNYQPTNEILVYGGVTSGFKSGDFSGGFLSSNPVEAARQLAPVLPEKVTDLEIGLKSTFLDRRLLVDLSAFYNIYRDEQVFIILPPIPGGSGLQLPVLDNAPKSHTDGVELEVVAKPLEGLTLTTNAAWLEARIDQFSSSRSPAAVDYTGHTLPLAPKYSFSGIIDYRHPIGLGIADFQFQASYRSMQHFDLTNNPWTSQGAYWLANMRLGYLFDNNRVEAAVFVHNLFGKQYLNFANDNTNPFGQIEDVVGAPRSVGVSIDYRY